MAARLALPARTALPHLLLVGFGPPSKFPGDHGQNTSQMSKCRQSSRGWLWSVPSCKWREFAHDQDWSSLGWRTPYLPGPHAMPLILGHVGEACSLRASAHCPPGPPRAWSSNACSHQISLGCARLMPEHRHVHETWGTILAAAAAYEQPQNCILRRSA